MKEIRIKADNGAYTVTFNGNTTPFAKILDARRWAVSLHLKHRVPIQDETFFNSWEVA